MSSERNATILTVCAVGLHYVLPEWVRPYVLFGIASFVAVYLGNKIDEVKGRLQDLESTVRSLEAESENLRRLLAAKAYRLDEVERLLKIERY